MKGLFIKYISGLEYGIDEFSDTSIDPEYVLRLSEGTDGLIVQRGIAEKYRNNRVPLIIKLNGKTKYIDRDPVTAEICSVQEAKEMGASCVAYTLYLGSLHEQEMFEEFIRIKRAAKKYHMDLITWIEPMGAAIMRPQSKETVKYAARVALEIGVDTLMMALPENLTDIQDIIRAAGKTDVLFTPRKQRPEQELYVIAKEILTHGGKGLVLGKNIWSRQEPKKILSALKAIIH